MRPLIQPLYTELFLNQEINTQLAESGFAILDISNPDALVPVIRKSRELLAEYPDTNGQFFNFGQLNDFDMRRRSYDLIQREVLPQILPLIDSERARLYAGTHLVKPPGKASGFDPHQDNTMVDELVSRSFIIWMPLQDINEENGTVYVFPKSHRFGNIYRSVSIPWLFRNVREEIVRYSVPVYPKTGQALVFDSALIHYSMPNRSEDLRIAVNAMAIGVNEPIIKCIYRRNWLRKFIDLYEVGMDYYLSQMNEDKPVTGYRHIQTAKYRERPVSRKELEQWLELLA